MVGDGRGWENVEECGKRCVEDGRRCGRRWRKVGEGGRRWVGDGRGW